MGSYPVKGNTVIGNDVWIGHKATVMPGIKIGDGAIIATNTAATKDIDPYTIVGGNPTREIRKRFSGEQIQFLLKLKWWDWPVEKITKNLHLLTANNLQNLYNLTD